MFRIDGRRGKNKMDMKRDIYLIGGREWKILDDTWHTVVYYQDKSGEWLHVLSTMLSKHTLISLMEDCVTEFKNNRDKSFAKALIMAHLCQ